MDTNEFIKKIEEEAKKKRDALNAEYEEELKNRRSDDPDVFTPPVETSVFIYFDVDGKVVETLEEAETYIEQVLDENGQLVREVWYTKNKNEEQDVEEGVSLETLYFDENDVEVEPENASFVVFRKSKDGQVVAENKYPISKNFKGPNL